MRLLYSLIFACFVSKISAAPDKRFMPVYLQAGAIGKRWLPVYLQSGAIGKRWLPVYLQAGAVGKRAWEENPEDSENEDYEVVEVGKKACDRSTCPGQCCILPPYYIAARSVGELRPTKIPPIENNEVVLGKRMPPTGGQYTPPYKRRPSGGHTSPEKREVVYVVDEDGYERSDRRMPPKTLPIVRRSRWDDDESQFSRYGRGPHKLLPVVKRGGRWDESDYEPEEVVIPYQRYGRRPSSGSAIVAKRRPSSGATIAVKRYYIDDWRQDGYEK